MNNNNLAQQDYDIFLIKMLFLLGFAGIGFVMSLIGFFYAVVSWVSLLAAGIFFLQYVLKKKMLSKVSKEFFISAILLFSISIAFSFFVTPTVFSGRDQGSISQAAIQLSKNHSLQFSNNASDIFFKIRGEGRALNFPGFYYLSNGSLITQFPLVYISWLALFFSVFGMYGFIIANTILFAMFLISFYLLLRQFTSKIFATAGIIFASTSFGIFWFTKYTLSENIALPLTWIACLALVLFWKEQRKLYLAALLSSLILLCFARIEGFAILAAMVLIVFLHKKMRAFIAGNKKQYLFLPAAIFALLLIADLWINFPFFKEITKAILPTAANKEATILPSLYLLKIYSLYGMIGFFVFSIFGISYIYKKGDYPKLIPFFLILPTLIYLYDSQITPDNPWMLRRLMFSILPAAIFYTTLFISEMQLKYKKNAPAIFIISSVVVILLAMNMPSFSRFATYSENIGTLEQVAELNTNFAPKSLVLIDQKTTGDGWNMIDEPLNSFFGTQSAYFFNIQDLKNLDFSQYTNVYLIAPKVTSQQYLKSEIGARLSWEKNFIFKINNLSGNSADPFIETSLPKKNTTQTEISIFKISTQ